MDYFYLFILLCLSMLSHLQCHIVCFCLTNVIIFKSLLPFPAVPPHQGAPSLQDYAF